MDNKTFGREPGEGDFSQARSGSSLRGRALFDRLATQPTMNLGKWTWDEAYER